jgi:hypothetical protein
MPPSSDVASPFDDKRFDLASQFVPGVQPGIHAPMLAGESLFDSLAHSGPASEPPNVLRCQALGPAVSQSAMGRRGLQIIPHQVGHHVQNLLGILPEAQQGQQLAWDRNRYPQTESYAA